MKYLYLSVCLIISSLFFSLENCAAQIDCKDFAVLVTATVDTITPSVTLNWNVDTIATGYYIYRKTKTATSWGATYLAKLSKTTQQYTDNNVVLDSVYEYWVLRTTDLSLVQSNGYIYVSIKLHPAEYRGTVILMVDSTYRDSFATQLTRLKFDLIGDGWTVTRHDISPDDSVAFIRRLVKNDYNADPANVTSLFLFGHVPVPYSGDIAPDGHVPYHLGAWPADGIYGDINGVYTDSVVDDTGGSYTANWNMPGDGKYDQSLFAGTINLEVGRVDLSNMDSFALSEPNLLIQYLNKDHAFRQKYFTAQKQSIIDDNFGVFGLPDDEAFASDAWRNFSALLGTNNVTAAGYFSSLNPQSCLWSYGCGGGWPLGAGGVGTTGNFAHDTVNSVFTMLFGSYFGDWNFPNDFMRSSLASVPMVLSSCWAGRPNWVFHFMGSGETLGFCARWSQNNYDTYYAGYGATMVHIALMGDPTLTMNIVGPAFNLQHELINSNKEVSLHWSPSIDTIRGYYVYHSPVLNGKYTRIASYRQMIHRSPILYRSRVPIIIWCVRLNL